jgi:Protein of unknown function (DUF551)
MTDWKTIDSAPRDGTSVLLYARCKIYRDENPTPVVGFWNKAIDQWKVAPEYLNQEEELLPSHWMEIPAAPTRDVRENEG